jgi:branched-chain amino acid transport system permease protein
MTAWLNRPTSRTLLAAAALTVWLVAFELLAANDYQVSVGTIVGTYALSALGLTVVVGRAGQLALGQAGFMAIGAYSVAYSTSKWHFPFLVALAGGAVIAFLFGLVVGYIALRLRGNYLAMATLAFGLIIYGLLNVNGPLGGPEGLAGIPPISIFGDQLVTPTQQYAFVWIIVALAFIVCFLYLRGRAGRELHALRDDELAASALGINITFRKLQAFGISAILGGLSGGIIAANSSVIDPTAFPPSISFQVFLMVVLGGLGSLGGAIAGAAMVVWLIQLVPGTGDWAFTVLGGAVIILMAVFPGGFAGIVSALLRGAHWLVRSRQRPSAPTKMEAEPQP